MSAVTDRLSGEDLRELARLLRRMQARRAVRLERERAEAEARAGDGGHDPPDGPPAMPRPGGRRHHDPLPGPGAQSCPP
ncbi:MAG TPA: hypothetical protein VFE59_21160 [Trebonia sp.]|nr:hypothetical protein [Trebonia sp.]